MSQLSEGRNKSLSLVSVLALLLGLCFTALSPASGGAQSSGGGEGFEFKIIELTFNCQDQTGSLTYSISEPAYVSVTFNYEGVKGQAFAGEVHSSGTVPLVDAYGDGTLPLNISVWAGPLSTDDFDYIGGLEVDCKTPNPDPPFSGQLCVNGALEPFDDKDAYNAAIQAGATQPDENGNCAPIVPPDVPFMKVIGSATAVCEGSVTISLETDYVGRAGIGLLLANGTDPVRFFDVNGSGTYSVVVGQFNQTHFPAEYTVFFGDNETVAENGVGQIDIDCSPVEPEPISRYACVPIDKLGNYELRHFESQEAYDVAIAAGAISATADTKCPTAPSTEIPGTETPGTETPGTETPGTEVPGTETPGTETPGTETPGTETPGTKTPDKPDTGQVQATSTPGVPVVVAPPSTGSGQDQISVWGYIVGAALSAAILIAGGVSLNLRRK